MQVYIVSSEKDANASATFTNGSDSREYIMSKPPAASRASGLSEGGSSEAFVIRCRLPLGGSAGPSRFLETSKMEALADDDTGLDAQDGRGDGGGEKEEEEEEEEGPGLAASRPESRQGRDGCEEIAAEVRMYPSLERQQQSMYAGVGNDAGQRQGGASDASVSARSVSAARNVSQAVSVARQAPPAGAGSLRGAGVRAGAGGRLATLKWQRGERAYRAEFARKGGGKEMEDGAGAGEREEVVKPVAGLVKDSILRRALLER